LIVENSPEMPPAPAGPEEVRDLVRSKVHDLTVGISLLERQLREAPPEAWQETLSRMNRDLGALRQQIEPLLHLLSGLAQPLAVERQPA
jgi:hypothetical protein